MIFPNITAFPIYWENGMKLSADHFQHLENSIEDAVRDSRSVGLATSGGFGLLPYSPFQIRNAQGSSPQSVRVILEACRAVLPGGYRVEILPENTQRLQLPPAPPFVEFVPSSGVRYHLFLTVSEKGRIPAGIPQTRPIRHPHLTPDYRLECIPHSRLSAVQNIAANRMKIAEWENGKVIQGYIPPTLAIKGFELLEKWHIFFQNQLENMVRISLQIIHENRNRDLARAAFSLPIVNYIRSSQGYFKWVLPGLSPIHLVAYYGNMAGLVEGLIETGDRDFVRNQLKNGEINGLRPNIHALLKPAVISLEEMAISIAVMQKFGESLLLTLQGLLTRQAPIPKTGEGNILSG